MKASYTHEASEAGHLYYFAPDGAGVPSRQITVSAILDIAADGTLAGVELIDDMPPPPDLHRPTYISDYHNDSITCSCGWQSPVYWDGMAYAETDFKKHKESSE